MAEGEGEGEDAASRARTNVQRWHYGKLIILWTWGAVLVGVTLYIVVVLPPDYFLFGTLLLLASGIVPIGLSIVTWRWLTGKEHEGP